MHLPGAGPGPSIRLHHSQAGPPPLPPGPFRHRGCTRCRDGPTEGPMKPLARESVARYVARAKRSLGQNFLLDDAILQRIVEASGLTPADSALEVGPGLGSLTRHLAAVAASVTAVEKDDALYSRLVNTLTEGDVTLIHGDALQLDLGTLVESMAMQAAPPPGAPGACIRVLANLPYNITQPFLERILPLGGPLASATLLLQEEAAERLVSARPGDVDWRGANLLLQYYSRPSIRFKVPRWAFSPAPKVNGAVVHLELLAPEDRPPVPSEAAFLTLVRFAFHQRRKMLKNTLAPLFPPNRTEAALLRLGLDAGIRAERLTLDQMIRLLWALAET
ncbi:KSGA1 [Auxenochlorella protothecoides x Auxenochlorella symbiontica]